MRRMVVTPAKGTYTVIDKLKVYSPGGGIYAWLSVGTAKETLETWNYPGTWPFRLDDYIQFHKEALLRCDETIERLIQRSATLGSAHPDLWGYLDFLYFSAITQTTVGYGDILPNKTSVRMLVVIQILVGYFVIVTMVSLLQS